MELRDLHMCDNCGGELGANFYKVDMSLVLVNIQKARQTAGAIQWMGGHFDIAEAMGMTGGELSVAGEFDESLWIHLLLCQDCQMKPLNLAQLAENYCARRAEKESKDGEASDAESD